MAAAMAHIKNARAIDLMCTLFSREDYDGFTVYLTDPHDTENVLDFILHLLCDPSPPFINMEEETVPDIKQQARQFMLKIINETPVIPGSLIVTGIRDRHWQAISWGHRSYHCTLKGELQGNVIALKASSGVSTVSCSSQSMSLLDLRGSNRHFVEKH